jgi:hypothetical protein
VSDRPRTIRLVLDSSAVAGWLSGSIAVGELIAEIDDEHGAVILPLPCLVEAAYSTGMLQPELLNALINHEAVFLLADNPEHWVELAALRSLVDGQDRASAAMQALECDVDVMTRNEGWYSGVAGGSIAHVFED